MKTPRRGVAIVAMTALWLVTPFANASDKAAPVTTVAVPGNGKPAAAKIAAKIDAEGTIHLLYETPAGPQYVKSLDKGKNLQRSQSSVAPTRRVSEGEQHPSLT